MTRKSELWCHGFLFQNRCSDLFCNVSSAHSVGSLGAPGGQTQWKSHYNIKGNLFRKGRRIWGVEEACLLTPPPLITDYSKWTGTYFFISFPTFYNSRCAIILWAERGSVRPCQYRKDCATSLFLCFIFIFLTKTSDEVRKWDWRVAVYHHLLRLWCQ